MRLVVALFVALLGVSNAQAQAVFSTFMAYGSGGGGGAVTGLAMAKPVAFYGQIKPNGPIEINRRSPLAPMLSLYDRGDGYYVSGTPDFQNGGGWSNIQLTNHQYGGCTGGTVYGFTSGSTAYGTAGLWPGLGIQTACSDSGGLGLQIKAGGTGATTGLAIDTASDLANFGNGKGYSVGCQFIRVTGAVSNDFGFYCGRTWISDGERYTPGNSCNAPGFMWAFAEGALCDGSSGALVMGVYVATGTSGSPAQGVLGHFTITPNKYYNMGLDCLNNGSASANCEWWLNGAVQSGSLTNTSIPTTLSSGETDVEIGATLHDDGLSNHTPAAYIFKLDFWPRKLSASEWQQYWLNPWIMYKPLGAPS